MTGQPRARAAVDGAGRAADSPAMQRNLATWTAFLLCCFAVVGLMGLFASYAAPLPYERAELRDAVLDRALAAGDNKAALEPLRDQLDDSAATVIDGTGPLPGRIAAARAAMRETMRTDAAAIGSRLRLELGVITVVAGAFGAAMLVAAARPR